MPHCLSITICLPSVGRRCQLEGARRIGSKRRGRTTIHKLDDDSLLNIFYLYRLALLNQELPEEKGSLLEGTAWDYERWWYKLAGICRRWKHIILGSASYLRLSLVCTRRTPIAGTLANSPPLPLMVYYTFDNHDIITRKDEEEINLALGYHDRIRRIRLEMPARYLAKFSATIDKEFPILEDLMLTPSSTSKRNLMLPKTFQAPQLRRLILWNFGPIGSPCLTTPTGIVLLSLLDIHPSAYFPSNDVIQQLSLMPQLQMLRIDFRDHVPSRDAERQLLLTPITAHVALPNLRRFIFRGTSAYLEALLPQMALPLLDEFYISFFDHFAFSVPCLLQFLNTAENFKYSNAILRFTNESVGISVHLSEPTWKHTFQVQVLSSHLGWQVSSFTKILNALAPVFSAVKHLTLSFLAYSQSAGIHNRVDRAQWHRFFGSFGNVETLRVNLGFYRALSRILTSDDGESPMELLPELNQLSVPERADVVDAFASFIDARRNTGRPVILVHH